MTLELARQAQDDHSLRVLLNSADKFGCSVFCLIVRTKCSFSLLDLVRTNQPDRFRRMAEISESDRGPEYASTSFSLRRARAVERHFNTRISLRTSRNCDPEWRVGRHRGAAPIGSATASMHPRYRQCTQDILVLRLRLHGGGKGPPCWCPRHREMAVH